MGGHLESEKAVKGMRVKKKDMDMYRGGGMYGNMKDKMMEGGGKLEIVTMKKGGKNVKKVILIPILMRV